MAEPLDAFPDVAGEGGDGNGEGGDENGDESEDDRALVARHQRAVRDLEGVTVDGLVYEYRTQFHQDPLVTQDATAYYLSVRGHVWDEFAERLGLSDEELARLKRRHAEQFEASVGERADEAGSGEAMILTKE